MGQTFLLVKNIQGLDGPEAVSLRAGTSIYEGSVHDAFLLS